MLTRSRHGLAALSLSGFIIGVRRPKGNGESACSVQAKVRICTLDREAGRVVMHAERPIMRKKAEKPAQGFSALIVFYHSVCSEFEVEEEHGFVFRPVPVPDFQDRDP